MKQKTKSGIGFFFLFLFLSVFASFPSPAEAADTTAIAVGDKPNNIALTPDGEYAYVTNMNSDSVSVINTESNTVTATITGFSSPDHIAIAPSGEYAYVINQENNSVSVISTATNTVTATITIGNGMSSGLNGLAITPDSGYVYVTNVGGMSVSVINTDTNEITATINVEGSPGGVIVTPDGKYLYVSQTTYNFDTEKSEGEILVINTATNTVEKKIAVEAYPHSLSVTPDGKVVCVVSLDANSVNPVEESLGFVSVINTDTNSVARVDVGCSPRGIAVTPNSQYACVTNLGTDDFFKPAKPINSSVSVVNLVTNTVSATLEVPVGSTPYAIAITPDGEYAYITYGGSDAVSAINITAHTAASAAPMFSPQLLVIALLVFVVAALLAVVVVKRRTGKSNQAKISTENLSAKPDVQSNKRPSFSSGGKHYRHT